MKLYLTADVLLLTEVFEHFRRIIFENYKIDPAKVLTISSTAIQSALLEPDLEIDAFRKTSSLKDFEDNVRLGLVSVV